MTCAADGAASVTVPTPMRVARAVTSAQDTRARLMVSTAVKSKQRSDAAQLKKSSEILQRSTVEAAFLRFKNHPDPGTLYECPRVFTK